MMMKRGNWHKFGIVVLTAGLAMLLFHCAGLVKLHLPDQVFREAEAWLVPYKNNQRQMAVESDVPPPYRISWKKRYRSVVTDHLLAVDRYLIFTVENGMLVFFDADLGERIGEGRLAPGFLHAPLLHNGILYYSANLGKEPLGAFDLSRLKTVWKKKLPHLNTSPLEHSGNIYVGSDKGWFYCFEETKGKKIWDFNAGQPIYGNPASWQDKIYFSNVKGKLFCLNAADGKVLWTVQLKENVFAGPVIGDKRVFLGTTAGILYAINAETGKIEWQLQTHGSIFGNAAYRDGSVYVGNNAHKLLAVSAKTGEIRWKFGAKGIINTAPLTGPEFVYFGCWDKNFYVLLRSSGKMVYRQEFKKPLKSSPIIYRGKIFFHVSNERIYCLVSDQTSKAEGSDR